MEFIGEEDVNRREVIGGVALQKVAWVLRRGRSKRRGMLGVVTRSVDEQDRWRREREKVKVR